MDWFDWPGREAGATGFWSAIRESLGPPDIDWCEAPLPALIEEPANTFSNLAYFIVALLIVRSTGKAVGRPLARAVFWMGLCSFVYHASNNLLTQFLDFLGMFLFLGLLLTWNARRAGLAPQFERRHYFLALATNSILLVSLRWLAIPIQLVVVANTLVMLASEGLLYRRKKISGAAYRPFLFGMALMGLAALCSALDLRGVWCDPHDHLFQGHAAWHVLSAASIYFIARFYDGLPGPPTDPATAGA